MFHSSPIMVETRPTPPSRFETKTQKSEISLHSALQRNTYLNPIFTYKKISVLIGF